MRQREQETEYEEEGDRPHVVQLEDGVLGADGVLGPHAELVAEVGQAAEQRHSITFLVTTLLTELN